jgi:hypothetical protein
MDGFVWPGDTLEGRHRLRCPHHSRKSYGHQRVCPPSGDFEQPLSRLEPCAAARTCFAVAPSIIGPVARLAWILWRLTRFLAACAGFCEMGSLCHRRNKAGLGAPCQLVEGAVLRGLTGSAHFPLKCGVPFVCNAKNRSIHPHCRIPAAGASSTVCTPALRPSPFRQLWNIATPHVALYSSNILTGRGIGIVVSSAPAAAPQGPHLCHLWRLSPSCGRPHGLDSGSPAAQRAMNDLLGLASVHLLPQLAGRRRPEYCHPADQHAGLGRPVVAAARLIPDLPAMKSRSAASSPGQRSTGAPLAIVTRLLDDPALAALPQRRSAAACERWSERPGGGGCLRSFAHASRSTPLRRHSCTGAK